MNEKLIELSKKIKEQKNNKEKIYVDERSLTIIRQNSLAHADAWIQMGEVKDLDEYFKIAESCEEWILRK